MAERNTLYNEWLARQLYQAVKNGDISKMKDLLGEGADPNHQLYWSEEWIEKWPPQYPPLHTACGEGNLDMVKILVSKGADIDRGGGRYSSTPLHEACEGGNKQLVDYLVREAGCKVDVRDKHNSTPLHGACGCGQKEVVKYLVEELKCDVGARNNEGESPLDHALKCENEGCIEVSLFLLSPGYGNDQEKIKLLCGACFLGELDLVKDLVEQQKVDPNVRSVNRWYPVHEACWRNNLHILKYLVENANCDVNARGFWNRSPLHIICSFADEWSNNLDIVKYLVEKAHCDIDVIDDSGDTPLDLATKNSLSTDCDEYEREIYSEIVYYLKSRPTKHSTGQKRTPSGSHEGRPPPPKRPRTQSNSQPQTQRECPNCEESCHIRYKSCPHCEHLFPSSSKSRAKPNQELKKNPANLLQIIQKKIDQLAQVGCDFVVLVHTDSSKSHGPGSSSRTRHTYRKYCSPGLAESFLESPLLYNSWKEHCNAYTTRSSERAQNSKTTKRTSKSPRRGQHNVNSRSSDESHDQGSGSNDGENELHDQANTSHDQGEGSHASNRPLIGGTRQSQGQQESSTGILPNTEHSPYASSDSAHHQPHQMSTIQSGPAQPAHNTAMLATNRSSSSNSQPYNFLPSSNPFPTRPLMPQAYPFHPQLFPSSSPYLYPFSPPRSVSTYFPGPRPPRPPLPGQPVNTDPTTSEHEVNIWS